MRRSLLTVTIVAVLVVSAIGATFTTKLTASDAAAGDFLGLVRMSGNTLVAATGFGAATGAAYVFTLEGGSWTEEAKLTPPAFDPSDFYARGVAHDGDTVAVGAVGDDTLGTDTGAVYVYVRSGATWSLEQKVTAPDPQDIHLFGLSVAVSGDTLVVGAYNDDDAGANAGAVYVFTRSGGEWLPEAKLIGSMVAPGDRFGLAVAIDGDTVVAGADTSAGIGSAYVFTRSGTLWSEEAWIPSGSVTPEDFGAAVAVHGDTALVAAPGDDSVAPNRGAAYVFERSGGAWTEVATLLSPTPVFNFGQSIALDGGAIAVGTTFDSAAAGLGGSVAVFTRTGGVWQLHEKITAFDAAFGDAFGNGVALRGKTLAVAAMRDDDAATDAGSVYLYDLDIAANEPPDCSAAAPSVAVLWPPDHKMVTVGIDGVTDPDGDDVTITIDAIYQDEPVDEKLDGSTSPDGAGVGSPVAEVRAERAASGDGRVYHIRFTATDGQGGSASGEVLVAVPRDRRCPSDDAVDGGALYDSTLREDGGDHRRCWSRTWSARRSHHDRR